MIVRKIMQIFKLLYMNLNKNCTFKSLLPSCTNYEDYIHIGKYCDIQQISSIGRGTFINDYTRVHFTDSIGRYCSISHNVKIGLGSHPLTKVSTSPLFYDESRGLISKSTYTQNNEKTIIGHDVLVSANAIILKGVKVGNGSVIAAGSVVIKDVPPYSIVGGVPAKVIRYRFEDSTIRALESSKWWEKDLDWIKNNLQILQSAKDFETLER